MAPVSGGMRWGRWEWFLHLWSGSLTPVYLRMWWCVSGQVSVCLVCDRPYLVLGAVDGRQRGCVWLWIPMCLAVVVLCLTVVLCIFFGVLGFFLFLLLLFSFIFSFKLSSGAEWWGKEASSLFPVSKGRKRREGVLVHT